MLKKLKAIKDILFATGEIPSQSSPSQQEVKLAINEATFKPRYPPFDNGFPLITIDEIIDTQFELIQRIKFAFGYSPEQFDLMVMPVIKNYASYVHLLPATDQEHHNNAGGLFRLGLEVGFYALQAADGKIYSNKETAERRRVLHPKWVYATFVAGLCSEMYLPYTTMTVVSSDGTSWPAVSKRLYDWAAERNSTKYYIHWTDNVSSNNQTWQPSPIFILTMVLPDIARDYLNEGNEIIFSSMLNSIGGMSRHSDGNLVGELVRKYKDIIIDKDIKANPSYYGKLTVGTHLAPTVIDIMRELIKDGAWTVNIKNSRIWYTKEGCFVIWGAAFAEISAAMKQRNVKGAPTSSETLAEMFLSENLIEAHRNGGINWQITVPNSPKLIDTIKIADPSILFDKEPIDILSISLLSPVSSKPVTNNPTQATAPISEAAIKDEVKPNVVKNETISENIATVDKVKVDVAVSPVEFKEVEVKEVVINKSENKEIPKAQNKPHPNAINKTQQTNHNAIVASESAVDSKSIIDQVSLETKRLINAIKADMKSNANEHPAWMSARGLVISRAEFESHGIPHIKVLDELVANNWLVRDPETKGIIHKTEKEGVKVSGYLINHTIALALGFEENNA